MTQKHTQTPWILDECCYGDNIIKGPNDEIITWDTEYYPVAPSVKDMAHIVKCVNMHDELVEVLQWIADNSMCEGAVFASNEALEKAGAL